MFIPKVSNSRLTFLGRYESGIFDDDGAEIPTYDPTTKRVFVINANAGVADVLDVSDPTDPSKVSDIDPGGDFPSGFTVAVSTVSTPTRERRHWRRSRPRYSTATDRTVVITTNVHQQMRQFVTESRAIPPVTTVPEGSRPIMPIKRRRDAGRGSSY